MRILIAEDERALNALLKKRLEEQSYSVDACLDGQEAMDYLACTEYDVILLDIMMPKKSGLEVLRSLRRSGKETPVLLLTARDGVEDRVLGLDAGFAAAVGLVALFCAVVNCPLAALALAIELFGGGGLLLFAAACAVSYLLSGYYSLYSGQHIIYSKLRAEYVNRTTH